MDDREQILISISHDLQLVSFEMTRASIDISEVEFSGEHKVEFKVGTAFRGKSGEAGTFGLYEAKVSASITSKEADSPYEVDVDMIGTFRTELEEDAAKKAIMSNGVMELYAIMKGSVYTMTSGAIALPSMTA